MIQPNELRIGNLITIYGVVHTVDGQMIANIERATKKGKQLVDDPSPITLTPEWLERAGFRKEAQDEKTFYDKPVGMDLYLSIHLEKFTFQFGDGGVDWLNNAIGKCCFVHQLQNLYFALTGQELQLKPDVT